MKCPSFPSSHLKGFWVYDLERTSNYDLKNDHGFVLIAFLLIL